MPFGSFFNLIPTAAFLVLHLIGFLVGTYLAYRSFEAGARLFGWGFILYAFAQTMYVSYHLDLTVILFAHTIAEMLVLAGLLLVFAGAAQMAAAGRRVSVR